MLADTDINAYPNLISQLNPENLHNCTYTLSVGSIFKPGTGEQEDNPTLPMGPKKRFWILGPTECLVVRTKEKLDVPLELCAYYGPLNRLAQKGVMLLNASVVEPGYSGHLSCFLVNFSSQDVEIFPDQEIAKVTFHKLDSTITSHRPQTVDDQQYEMDLASSARKFETSFLGVSSIEERAAKAAEKAVSSSIKFGGIVLLVLLAFAQLEPFISKHLWESLGVVTTSRRIEGNNLQNQLEVDEKKLSELNEKIKYAQDIAVLNNKVMQLQTKIDALQTSERQKRGP